MRAGDKRVHDEKRAGMRGFERKDEISWMAGKRYEEKGMREKGSRDQARVKRQYKSDKLQGTREEDDRKKQAMRHRMQDNG